MSGRHLLEDRDELSGIFLNISLMHLRRGCWGREDGEEAEGLGRPQANHRSWSPPSWLGKWPELTWDEDATGEHQAWCLLPRGSWSGQGTNFLREPPDRDPEPGVGLWLSSQEVNNPATCTYGKRGVCVLLWESASSVQL